MVTRRYKLLENVVRFAEKHSDDPMVKVGACVVNGTNHTFGANRFYSLPEGKTKEEAVSDRALKLEYITHAEVDAINQAGQVAGATMYVNYTPCDKCAQKIVDAGVKRVVSVKMTNQAIIDRWEKYWVVGRTILSKGGVEFVEELV